MIHELSALSWKPYIDPQELAAEGYVQEVNRRFFHPLGLALHVARSETGVVLKGVIDCRDVTGGVVFNEAECWISEHRRDAARKITRDWARRGRERLDEAGWMIQPVDEL